MLVTAFIKITGILFAYIFLKPKIIGKENLKHKGKIIIVSNHTSNFDPILIHMIFWYRRVYTLTAEILFTYNRFFSFLLRQLGCFSIDRKNSDSKSIYFVNEKLQKNKAVLIFPEGKKSKEIIPFKTGAVFLARENDCYILPIYIDGHYGWFKRVKVVVGEKIDFFSNENNKINKNDIIEKTEALSNTIKALKNQL